jgi:glucose-1-phosphate thymidylyltransferase
LLPVGGRPMVDWILDKIREAGIGDVHLVTNARFAGLFAAWADGKDVRVHDDGTTSNDDRLGAIGDVRFVQKHTDLDDDLLVIDGDNLFDYPLTDLIAFAKGKGSAVAVYDVGDLELVRKYSIVELDEDDRIVGFVEKPQHPTTTLAATATYLYTREHAALIAAYLDEGNPPDQPGNYVAWLHRRAPVYGYRFAGGWYDVGDTAQLHEADTMMRRRVGLPVRGTYSLD